VRGETAAPANRGAITISIMLAPIMQGVDTTIANVALPHMQGSLSASQDQIAWVLTSYIVAAAIMTPLTGWLVWGFSCQAVVIGFCSQFFVRSGKGRSSSRRLRSSSRSARKGSRDRNASGAWRLTALASLVVSQRLDA
jgi:MFS family permease